MLFRFDTSQEYQLLAIESVVRLFEGQVWVAPESDLKMGSDHAVVPNRLDLPDSILLANLQQVQADNGLKVDDKLELIRDKEVSFPNFSVEMETGTGKTYIYIRTALELYRRYGLRKFIIVVPSIAIKEGVLKTLQITQSHLSQLYSNLPYKFYTYDSSKLTQVRGFVLSDSVEIMVMTLASFQRDANIIRQSRDGLSGAIPLHLLKATRPVLILDEPQNMESDLARSALASLNPLCALRYSATHRNPYNVVYRLTPFEAYRQGLVKRIEVVSVLRENDFNHPYINVLKITSEKNKITAKL